MTIASVIMLVGILLACSLPFFAHKARARAAADARSIEEKAERILAELRQLSVSEEARETLRPSAHEVVNFVPAWASEISGLVSLPEIDELHRQLVEIVQESQGHWRSVSNAKVLRSRWTHAEWDLLPEPDESRVRRFSTPAAPMSKLRLEDPGWQPRHRFQIN